MTGLSLAGNLVNVGEQKLEQNPLHIIVILLIRKNGVDQMYI